MLPANFWMFPVSGDPDATEFCDHCEPFVIAQILGCFLGNGRDDCIATWASRGPIGLQEFSFQLDKAFDGRCAAPLRSKRGQQGEARMPPSLDTLFATFVFSAVFEKDNFEGPKSGRRTVR